MDRIRELLAQITTLSDADLTELRGLIMAEISGDKGTDDVELAVLEELADASGCVRDEVTRREQDKTRRAEAAAKLATFKSDPPAAAEVPAEEPAAAQVEQPAAEAAPAAQAEETPAGGKEVNVEVTASGPLEVPADRQPVPRVKTGTTVITAAADIPGFGMGQVIETDTQLAKALINRINTLRGSRGGDGELVRVASAELQVPADQMLTANDTTGNLAKVEAFTSPQAITAAGGTMGVFRETRYDLFDLTGVTDRPVRSSLPVFRAERGGVRFMRAPTLADVNGVVGIWTHANDLAAATNPMIRKPSFRVGPPTEVYVDTQAITMIMTIGNLVTRVFPELVRRHQQLALVAQARVAEQQLLTQIGALSTAVTGRTQQVSAVRELLLMIEQATAAYRNRHRMGPGTRLRAIMPVWFQNLLRADVMLGGDDIAAAMQIADAQIEGWFRARGLSITWALDGEAGQDYSGITATYPIEGGGTRTGFAAFPANMIWYLFAEGTFAFMDGGTLDLGLVRDSTLNAANDYQLFVETWENVAHFGNESFRITTPILPTGRATPRG